MKKKKKKNKYENIKQKSFYFKDYLETNKSNKKNRDSIILQDRVYLLFFLFFSLITIFSIKIIIVQLFLFVTNLLFKNLRIQNYSITTHAKMVCTIDV